MSGSATLPHSLRVNQLDARRLDADICTLLRQQLNEIPLGHLRSSLDKYQPELDAVLQTALWRYTIWVDAPTPGGALQNVVYGQASSRGALPKALRRSQKVAFLAINVLLPWLLVRLKPLVERLEGEEGGGPGDGGFSRQSPPAWLQAAARWCLRSLAPRVGALQTICAALNFVVFLRSGVFSSLGDRLLGVRMLHVDAAARRQVAYEYMNRVMIWNGFSEFLMTVLPLVNLARVRQAVSRRVFPKAMLKSMELGAERSCGFCGASPVMMPMRADCGHVFCYYCIASEQMASPKNVPCPHCSARIQSFGHAG